MYPAIELGEEGHDALKLGFLLMVFLFAEVVGTCDAMSEIVAEANNRDPLDPYGLFRTAIGKPKPLDMADIIRTRITGVCKHKHMTKYRIDVLTIFTVNSVRVNSLLLVHFTVSSILVSTQLI